MESIFDKIKYDANGLVPVITQDVRTDEVLMLAYMNREALELTLRTGKAHYYSRSRKKLWLKGETSGHFQRVKSIGIDCDGDTLLIKVEQVGAACHTGHRSCFFTRLDADDIKNSQGIKEKEREGGVAGADNADKLIDNCTRTETGLHGSVNACHAAASGEAEDTAAEGFTKATGAEKRGTGPEVLGEVFGIISDRRIHPKEGSYTNYLFSKGLDKILKKIGEEASEVIIAAKNGSRKEISAEIADLLYHIMVLLSEKNMTLVDVYEELNSRK